MRPEEYLALQWTDLDLAKNEIAITRTLYWPRTGGYQFIDRTKSKNSQRIISVSSELMKQLRDHHATQLIYKSAMSAKGKWKEHNLIFAADTGAPFFTHNLGRYFKRLLTNAGLDPAMRLYDLRHSCATLLLTNGVNPKIVSERLGHASVAFTLDTYCHVLPNDQQMATEAMIRMVGCWETGGKQEDQREVSSVLSIGRRFRFGLGWRLIEAPGKMAGASGTHPVRGKGRSPPNCGRVSRTFFQPDMRTAGASMKGVRYVE